MSEVETNELVNGRTVLANGAAGAQLSLLDGESDEALLMPKASAEKVFTAKTVAKQEQKRNHILDLLSFGLPVDVIAERCGCSTRIVNLLGGQYSQHVATNMVQFAQVLKAKAAKFLFFAEQKAPQAKFGELMIGVGIATQRATELELAAAGSLPPEDKATEVENEQLKGLRAKIKQLKSAEGKVE